MHDPLIRLITKQEWPLYFGMWTSRKTVQFELLEHSNRPSTKARDYPLSGLPTLTFVHERVFPSLRLTEPTPPQSDHLAAFPCYGRYHRT